jgi:hypothetical protein
MIRQHCSGSATCSAPRGQFTESFDAVLANAGMGALRSGGVEALAVSQGVGQATCADAGHAPVSQ